MAAAAAAPKKMITMSLADLSTAALKVVTKGAVASEPVPASSLWQPDKTPIVFLVIRRPG